MLKCIECHKNDIAPLTYWERFRKWMFGFFAEDIKDMRDDLYTQGFGKGYSQGFEHGANLNKETQKTAHELMNEAIEVYKNLHPQTVFDTNIHASDVLEFDKNVLKIGGEPVEKETIKNLKIEIKTLKNFRIWQILQETLKQKAIDKGMKESQDFTTLLSGKLMLHSLGIMRSIVDTIDNIHFKD